MGTRIRGIRTSLPGGSFTGRLPGKGIGPAQDVSLTDLATSLQGVGALGLPGGATSTASIADGDILSNISGGSASPVGNTLTAILDHIMGSTEGQILQRGASAWQVLATGTVNQLLMSGGAAALNSWEGLSALLDTVLGSTEGNILQRGASAWQVLAPGTAGQVLTSQGAAALNHWAAGGGGTTIGSPSAWSGSAGYSVGNTVTYQGATYLCCATVAAPAGSATQWSNQNLMTISTTNTTNDTAVSQAGANGVAQGSVGKTAGKQYYEFVASNLLDNGDQWGIEQAALANNAGGSPLGTIGVSAGWGGGSGSFAGVANSKRGAVAFDVDNKKLWITADVTAVPINWNGQTVNDPSSGLSAVVLTGTMGTVYPLFYSGSSASQKTILYTRDADFLIPAIPSGFSGWRVADTPNTSPDQDAAHWVGVPLALENGTTATTQAVDDNSTKLATTAYADAAVPETDLTSWTPTDLSGAGLPLTINAAQYYQIGKHVDAFMEVTYPVTADANVAKLSLPVAPNTALGIMPFGFIFISGGALNTTEAAQIVASGGPPAWIQFDKLVAAASIKNSDLSSSTILCQFSYIAA